MLNEPPNETHTGFSKYFLFFGVALIVAGFYVGWVFSQSLAGQSSAGTKGGDERRSQDRQTFEGDGRKPF